MTKKENPRGSVTLLFAMLLFPLAVFFVTLTGLADHLITGTLSERIVESACRSVLAEFDRDVEKKYGFYAVRSSGKAEDSLEFFLRENFDCDPAAGLSGCALERAELSAKGSLAEIRAVKEQIRNFMELRLITQAAEDAYEAFSELAKGSEEVHQALDEPAESAAEDPPSLDWKAVFEGLRERNDELKELAPNENKLDSKEGLYQTLPSLNRQYGEEEQEPESDPAFLDWLWERVREAGENLLTKADVVVYAEGMFSNLREAAAAKADEPAAATNLRGGEKTPGFFTNEVEYLIKGSGNEFRNAKAVRRRVIALRCMGNMISLVRDNAKMELIRAAGDTVGEAIGGPWGELASVALLVTVWSWIEAGEDWDALMKGQKVPLVKSPANWKTQIFSDVAGTEYEDAMLGLDYGDYLKLLLFLCPTDRTVARIQDLLYLEDGGKLPLSEYLTGIDASGSLRNGWQRFGFHYECTY